MGHYPLHLIKEVAENLQTTDTIEVFRRVVRMAGCAANVKGQLGITNRCRKAPESIPCLICANCSKILLSTGKLSRQKASQSSASRPITRIPTRSSFAQVMPEQSVPL